MCTYGIKQETEEVNEFQMKKVILEDVKYMIRLASVTGTSKNKTVLFVEITMLSQTRSRRYKRVPNERKSGECCLHERT